MRNKCHFFHEKINIQRLFRALTYSKEQHPAWFMEMLIMSLWLNWFSKAKSSHFEWKISQFEQIVYQIVNIPLEAFQLPFHKDFINQMYQCFIEWVTHRVDIHIAKVWYKRSLVVKYIYAVVRFCYPPCLSYCPIKI